VAVESLNANYSFKYLGKEPGVSPYTFIDERHFLWHHDVISAAEREAAYVIDGLMHNDVIKSDIHSTDTHGYSEIIFGTLHLLGFAFAPRIKDLKRQQLYAFRKRREYEQQGYELLPDGYINMPLLEAQWDEMLRFIATIKLKETTASQLFRRLNSYSKQHPLYQALKEFGKIPKSDFILRFVDDGSLAPSVCNIPLSHSSRSHGLGESVHSLPLRRSCVEDVTPSIVGGDFYPVDSWMISRLCRLGDHGRTTVSVKFRTGGARDPGCNTITN
jgi:Tn3 transposase DDE domain-containing protein